MASFSALATPPTAWMKAVAPRNHPYRIIGDTKALLDEPQRQMSSGAPTCACPSARTVQNATMSRSILLLWAALACLVLTVFTGCASAPRVYHQGETQKGLATWYGNGHHTASGERFDRDALTAAHRHLPFGTIVLVTNLNNGRSVQVRINDRGPFGDSDRIIDVSSTAADILQMKKAGIVPVEIEVLKVGHQKYHKS